MPFQIVRNDITRVAADAVVNAANERLSEGGGVCGAIFEAAGAENLRRACAAAGGCETGKAVITPGFGLKARYVIHAVGPVWRGGGAGEEELLRSAYRSALRLAAEKGLESVAFPLLSAGIYGYPKEQAFRVAVEEIAAFLRDSEMNVTLVLYDAGALKIGEKYFKDVRRYIDERYIDARRRFLRGVYAQSEEQELTCDTALRESELLLAPREAAQAVEKAASPGGRRSLEDLINKPGETFSQMLLRLIDEKGKTDAEVYKKANVDRKLFSKIRSDKDYRPKKETVFAFAVALELSLDETKDLLLRAGFAISPSRRFDLILQYFIERGIYNIFDINETLFAFGQKLLGA
ncbi:MAG TPA: macro domain-containing protein [Clostridiales bacterium]|nr:MAG: O-acetyl-ADP-ribose deacetylase [Firmicutes bacterium ADurb.Bin262]HOU09340.1 macro domain-containing protein [Clostridiales bacterium]HQK74304.1 macro domain-containing protein [Clostridiales bacterium]